MKSRSSGARSIGGNSVSTEWAIDGVRDTSQGKSPQSAAFYGIHLPRLCTRGRVLAFLYRYPQADHGSLNRAVLQDVEGQAAFMEQEHAAGGC
jgi:hypothetical protein|mmetsp:Transcript_54030/g.90022  ORF Transcript_54030/g.90022 Transcript_54030/m.90022 type:complete len:93 (-) Transcript_54030:133-411(-)